ncbi:hypothetical protein HK098_008013, partial [Nowakowskiella sp. JEL0407]
MHLILNPNSPTQWTFVRSAVNNQPQKSVVDHILVSGLLKQATSFSEIQFGVLCDSPHHLVFTTVDIVVLELPPMSMKWNLKRLEKLE